jgi:hypothetical protein
MGKLYRELRAGGCPWTFALMGAFIYAGCADEARRDTILVWYLPPVSRSALGKEKPR